MPSSKYTVSVDLAAKSKIETHTRFLAQLSVPAARQLRNTYFSALKSLEDNPQRCPRYEPDGDYKEELHYLLFAKRYRIVFEIVDNAVYIYDIQDCRQGVDKNLV